MTEDNENKEHVSVGGFLDKLDGRPVEKRSMLAGIGVPKEVVKPISDAEFNKAFLDPESVDPVMLKQQQKQVMTAGVVETECVNASETFLKPRPRTSKLRTPLTAPRKQQAKIDAMGFLPYDYGKVYACDKPVAQKLFSARERVKPKWAVKALVLLRDEGRCQVCHSEYTDKGTVVMRKPYVEQGQYDEYNCISICVECAKVWSVYKNFYMTPFDELDKMKQYLWVLQRRGKGLKGAKILSDNEMVRYKQVRHKIEDEEIRCDMAKEDMVRKVALGMSVKHLSSEEATDNIVRMLRGDKGETDSKSSDNENKELEGCEPQSEV